MTTDDTDAAAVAHLIDDIDDNGDYHVRQPYLPTPDIEEINDLYADGKIDAEQLDTLQDAALEAYPPDGRRSDSDTAELLKTDHRGYIAGTDHNAPISTLLIGVFVGVLLATAIFAAYPEFVEWLFDWEIHQPGVLPL